MENQKETEHEGRVDTESRQWYHDHVTANKDELSRSFKCGCVSCLEIFSPVEIENYIRDKDGLTAMCPYCSCDSVIGDVSGMEMTKVNLKKLHKKWF